MNWVQFKDPVSHMCWHCGSILVSYTRGGKFEPFYCNDKYFVTEFSKFNENIQEKVH